MRITNKELLDRFLIKHTNAINAVNKWTEIVESNDFKDHNELKSFFPSADYVGNNRYVFNIKGNTYRFVIMVVFLFEFAEIRFCGTHASYDKIKDIKNI